jgi:predicted small lipoprotein YifL
MAAAGRWRGAGKHAGKMLSPKSRLGDAICYADPVAGVFGERSLAFDRLNVTLARAALIAVAFALAACGRNGPPLPPPGPAVQPAPNAQAAPAGGPAPAAGGPVASGPTVQDTAQKNGFDIFGNPVAPPGQKKSFLLDPLLQ